MFEDLNRFARNDWSIRLDDRPNPNTGINSGTLRALEPWEEPRLLSQSELAEKSASIRLANENARSVAAQELRGAALQAAVKRASVGSLAVALIALAGDEISRRGVWDTFTSWDDDPLTFSELFSPSQSATAVSVDDKSALISIAGSSDKVVEISGAPSGHRYLYTSVLLPAAFVRRFHNGSQPQSQPTGSETPSWS